MVLIEDSDGLGWLLGVLSPWTRLAAAGCSSIAVKRSLQVHQDLRTRQGFHKAYKRFVSCDEFKDW